jgi:hypothetical protein
LKIQLVFLNCKLNGLNNEKIRAVTEEAINEYGEQTTDYERDKMRWLFLRGTQYQIGTFDAAWNLSDPWPGEGEETGVLAGSPELLKKVVE